MEIRYINQAMLANDKTVIPVGGRYARVLSSTNPFVLEVGRGGQFVAKIEDAVAGDSIRCAEGKAGFDALRVTTSGNETVKIVITDGQITRDSANLDVSDRAARLLGVVYGSLAVPLLQILSNGLNLLGALVHGTLGVLAQVAIGGVNALQMTNRGVTYGAVYKASSNMAANTSDTGFSAASNTNGAMVWRAGFHSQSATTTNIFSIAAHTAAPNAPATGDVIATSKASALAAGAVNLHGEIEGPIFIAAGKGVYFTSGALETAAVRFLDYTLL